VTEGRTDRQTDERNPSR